ncbi:MAG: MBL fold metallo-hydrolase [Clostridia bacterium]
MDYLEGVQVLCHSAIKIERKDKVIYFDPFQIEEEYHDADYIFCTHEHYDHFSPEDIEKVMKPDTVIITVPKTKSEALKLQPDEKKIITVEPYEEYTLSDFSFETVPAYNEKKLFHTKKNKWVGYKLKLDGICYYVAGDTDHLRELENIQCDVAFLPVGGMYTMNYKQAAELVNEIKPKVVVPTHYGSIIGGKEDAEEFAKLVDKAIEARILIK